MELTKEEKLLIGYLRTFGISKGMAAAIYMNVRERPLEMCKYFWENGDWIEKEIQNDQRGTETKLLGIARVIREKLDAEGLENSAITSPDEQSN